MVFGGIQEENKKIIKSVEAYDPGVNKWEFEPGFEELANIYAYSVINFEDRLYIIGGQKFSV